MKNKKLTYGLLVFVVLLWGAIGYKLYQTYFPEEIVELELDEEPMDIESIRLSRQEYELTNNYTDPFLKNTPFQYSNTQTNPTQQKKVTKPPVKRVYQPKINWPNVEYLGRIANKQAEEQQKGIVLINEKERLVREGDEIEEIQIVDLQKDSIQLIFKEQKKTILLKKS